MTGTTTRTTTPIIVAFVAVLTVAAPVGGAIGAGAGTGAGATPAAAASTADATAAGSTLVVDDDGNDCSAAGYASVARAVNQSSPGDVVRVCAGTYVESVTVDHALTLVGDPGAVLDGNGSLTVGVRIAASDVTVEGLTIRAYTRAGISADYEARTVSFVTIRNNRIAEIDPAGNVRAHRGIRIDGNASTVRTDWTIAGNTLVDTDSYGVSIASAGFVEKIAVRNNTIRAENQSAGLEAILVAGFGFEPVRDVTIRNNDIDTGNGIRIANNGGVTVQGTVIEGNDISAGFRAVYINPYCGVGNTNCTATQRGTTISDNQIDAENGIVVDVEDTARLRNLRIVDGNVFDVRFDAVRIARSTPASAVAIHGNEFAGDAAFGVNNRNKTAVVNATGNDWGRLTGPSSGSDPDAPFADPVTGQLADGGGAAVTEGATAGVSNVRFDPAVSARRITSCTVVNSPGRYVLGSDILNSSARVCINVTASDVLIDGAGHTVEGQSAFPSFGVLVHDPTGRVGNVTVRNLRVANWATGIGYRNATGGRIARIDATGNYDGIATLRGDDLTVAGARLVNNTFGGDVLSSTGVTVRNTTVRGGDYGLRLRSTDGARLSGNDLRSNAVAGVTLSRSIDNVLRNNTVRGSAVGIGLYSASDANVLIDNRAVDNGLRGIDVRGSDANRLEGNRLVGNGKGVRLSGAADTRLLDTVARNNSRDFYAEAGSVGTDVDNLTLTSATVSFEGRDVAVDAVGSPPAAPTGTPAIGRYVSVEPTNRNASGFDPADSWAFLNVSYTDADASGVNESTLQLWRYNRTTGNWSLAGTPNGVDTTANYVFANVTTFSVFAPLAGGTTTGPDTGGLQISLRPRNGTAAAGGTVTYDLVASNVTRGISTYDLNLSVANGSVARIGAVDFRLAPDSGATATFNSTIPSLAGNTSAAEVRLQVLGVRAPNGRVTLARITVEGRNPGTTRLSISDVLVGDRNDTAYTIAGVGNATVQVTSKPEAPIVTDDGKPAKDPDNDGDYEDVDGSGSVNIIDAAVFLDVFDSATVQNNVDLFDFNDDAVVNILDVTRLLEEV